MSIQFPLDELEGFDWDPGNREKNWKKHKVTYKECEEAFFNQPLIIEEDVKHSNNEKRLYALGKTNENRRLFLAFTIRKQKVRVISARDQNKEERRLYATAEKNTNI